MNKLKTIIWHDINSEPPKNYIWNRNGELLEYKDGGWKTYNNSDDSDDSENYDNTYLMLNAGNNADKIITLLWAEASTDRFPVKINEKGDVYFFNANTNDQGELEYRIWLSDSDETGLFSDEYVIIRRNIDENTGDVTITYEIKNQNILPDDIELYHRMIDIYNNSI